MSKLELPPFLKVLLCGRWGQKGANNTASTQVKTRHGGHESPGQLQQSLNQDQTRLGLQASFLHSQYFFVPSSIFAFLLWLSTTS